MKTMKIIFVFRAKVINSIFMFSDILFFIQQTLYFLEQLHIKIILLQFQILQFSEQ
ncbi:unnamed protein product [Paramecium sonneborni]|uniref:Transmembrane protein n=1 Tax=Paramecium sonneborni TaxID=65129 RepID=A0A8S1PME5_9CILI|nr:unnamed protein product [Paramecium sonneborni]